MRGYDAVVFDLDGTLTESEPGITKSVQYAVVKSGLPPLSGDELRKFIGPPLEMSFREVAGMDEAAAARAVEYYRERFSEVGWRENSVYPGIAELLRALKARGTRVSVATTKPRVFAERVIDHFGLAPFIERVEAATLANTDDDKSAMVRRALPDKYQRACCVGDRKYDMAAARAVGIEAIGAMYGYGSREELDAAGATAIAEDVDRLSLILLGEALPRGKFIALDGSDGCGKSTQLARLSERLRSMGFNLTSTREPGGCPLSEKIRSLVLDVKSEGMTAECEAYLFAAARAQHVSTVIRPALEAGRTVLSDRFVDASAAYQGAGRGLGVDEVIALNDLATGGLRPDLTVLLTLPAAQALSRRSAESELDRIERENNSFLERVADGYAYLAEKYPDRIRRVDASQTPDEVERDVLALVTETLNRI